MNKKRLFVFVVFILLLFFLMTFAGGSRNNIIATRLVEFVDSFNSETISAQNIEVGKDAEVPEDPYHSGFVFTGWFLFDNHREEITNFTEIKEDLKVIALYADDINRNGIDDEKDAKYTIRFIDGITNEVLKTQTVLVGMDATAPSPLEHTGYIFGGWESGYTNVTSNRDIRSIYNSITGPVITIDEDNAKNMIVYNDIPSFSATAVDSEGKEVEVTITHEIDKDNIGNYIITYTATDENGLTTTLTSEFEVLKREIEITIDNKTSVYKESLQTLTYELTNGKVFESPEIVLTKAFGSNVGTYPITGNALNENYDVTFINGTYTITKANYNVDVKVDDKDLTYNGEEQEPKIDNLDKLPEDVKPTVTYDDKEDKPKDAGEYEVEIKFTCEDDNYNCPEDIKETITINKAKVTLSADDKESVFGDALKPLTYSVTDGEIFGSDNLSINVETTATPTSNVGTYDITIEASNDNYDITLNKGIYTITKKGINIPGTEEKDPETGEITSVTGCIAVNPIYTGSEITLANNGIGYTVSNNTATNTGSHNIIATLDGNHVWNTTNEEEKTTSKTFSCNIAKANAIVKMDDQEKAYGSENPAFTYSAVSGFVGGDTASVINVTSSTTATKTSNVGDYTITGTATATNYNVTVNPGTLTITNKKVSVPTTLTGCINPKGITYTGSEITLANNGIGYTVSNNTGINANSYEVIARLNGNYTWSDESITTSDVKFSCVIDKANAIVKIDDQEKAYGSENPTFTYSAVSGFVGGDTASVVSVTPSTSATKTSNVGDYTITGTATATNYNVTVNPGTLTITNKKISVPTTETGCINPNGTTYTGSEITLANNGVGYTVSNNIGKNADTYTVVATLNDNYEWNDEENSSTKEFTCNITKDSATNPTLTGYNEAYDGEEHTFTVEGAIGGTVKYSTDNTTWSETKPTRKNVGTTTVYVKVFGDKNHTDTDAITTSITVTKANVTVKADNKEIEFGSTVKSLTYTVSSGVIYNNDFVPTLSSSVTAAEPILGIGKYPIVITATNDNYNITLVNGVYTITKKGIDAPTTTSACNNVTFNGNSQVLANNKEGYTVSNNTATNAGSYTVTATLDGNYKWSDNTTGDKTFTCTVSQMSIPVVWNNPLIFKADGSVHLPTATATGVNNESVSLTISNVEGYDGYSAKEQKAIATTTNKNYTLTNDVVTYSIEEPIISMDVNASIKRNGETVTGDTVEYNDIITYTVTINNTGNVDGSVLITDSEISNAIEEGKLELITNNANVNDFLNEGLTLEAKEKDTTTFTFQFKVTGDIGSTFKSKLSYKVETKDTVTLPEKTFKIETTIDYFEVTSQAKNVVLTLDVSYSMCNYTRIEKVFVGYTEWYKKGNKWTRDSIYEEREVEDTYYGNCGLAYANDEDNKAGTNNRMTKMQNAAMSFIDTIANGETSVCIVTFPRYTSGNEGAVDQGCSKNPTTLKEIIRGLKNCSGTPYEDALLKVEDMFENKTTDLPKGNKNFVVFLSDGEPNPLGDAYAVANRLKSSTGANATILTMGIDITDTSYLTNIASQVSATNTNKYYFDATSSNIGTVFNEIADVLSQPTSIQTILGVGSIKDNIDTNKLVRFVINRVGVTTPIEMKYNTVAEAIEAGYIKYNTVTLKYEIVASKFTAGDQIKFYYYKK